MSTFDVSKNKSICVLPWVHKFLDVDNKEAPCCMAKGLVQNETMSQIREEMLSNKKPSHCTSCYKSELVSGWSHRLHETKDWIKKFGEPDISKPSVEYLDVRFDPTCNLKCKFCNPGSSTLWQKEKNVTIPFNKQNADYITSVDKHKLKKVYLAGGEPTFIPLYQDFLNDLYEVNKECEVVINTNLKRLPDAWKTIIKRFPNLTVVCSLDATEQLARYVRYPLDWKVFEENVAFASENAPFFQFTLVACNLTIHKMHDTCTWMSKYSRNININMLVNPEQYSEKAIPMSIRSTYVDSLKSLLKFKVGVYYASRFRSAVFDLIKRYSTNPYEQEMHKKLLDDITEQDSHRTLRLQDVDDFLYSWIYK